MPARILVERDAPIPMRDGVILRADIYRPDPSEPLPALVQRTPYGKNWSSNSLALTAAERGYAVVIQDTRGRWASGGEQAPFIHEKADGYDTVEWAARQPWCNGRVGMFGGSYVGYTQLAAAAAQPPALHTITPNITFFRPQEVFYHNGALELGLAVNWNLGSWAQMALMRSTASETEKAALWHQWISAMDGMSKGDTFNTLPLENIPVVGRSGFAPFFYEALSHPPDDPYWEAIAIPYQSIQVPVLHLGGWYDSFISSTWRDYLGLLDAGNPRQKMVIGPWTHGDFSNLAGEMDFGVQASDLLVCTDEIHLRWFDYWLKEIPNGIMDEPPLRLFLMGTNQWREAATWPLPGTCFTPFFLHSSGSANGPLANGSLDQTVPGSEPVDTYLYDPRHPIPSQGGGLCCWPAALPPGVYDQRRVEARPDVLVYTSQPLATPLEVTGPVQVHLWVATNAPGTDFVARLVDAHPSGYAANLSEGIFRLAPGRGETALGEPVKLVIELAPTSLVFQAGHCLRLEIMSSFFPRYDRNPNTGGNSNESSELRTALQTIYHDLEHPSHIVLPVIQ